MKLIDADAMLARLEAWNTSDSIDKALYNFTLHRILEQPIIEPQRKKGRWTKDNACEFCGFQPWFERGIHTLSFCPNCGARMEGIENEKA